MSQLSTISVTVANRPDMDVVSVAGDLDASTADRLRDVVLDADACRQPVLVIDLNSVAFLDSQGIASLVGARRAVVRRDAELVLACSDPHLRKLLRICRLDTVLRVVPTVAHVARDDGVA